jgi:hypothetical protein
MVFLETVIKTERVKGIWKGLITDRTLEIR